MQNLWGECKKELETKIDYHNFISYIEPVTPISYENNELSLMAPSSFIAHWLEKHYMEIIMEILDKKTKTKNSIFFVIDKKKSKEVRAPAPAVKQKKKKVFPKFESNYSFDTFVPGKCNEFAYAAALSCAKQPGSKYNPLFLYGGVGLGKTHLMQSIGGYISARNNEARVMYLSSEHFVNQMISSLKNKHMENFRERFRNLDVLLVDDIQFIAGKDRTQEEFFHTFNALFEMGKQVVISSDQFPKDIKKLEERLKSRFEWGLIADIQPPDVETKIAIINKKASINGYKIPADVALFLAQTIRSNIRELEGCMARIVAYSSLTGKPINLETAKETLEGVYSEARKHIGVTQIMKLITSYFELKPYDLKSKKRSRNMVVPRQIAMFLCREFTEESLPQIGQYFGGRDHSTVIHAYNKIKKELEVNTKIYNDVTEIKKKLNL
ncbi:MAG: chromosomal replication initiator protein DnaA [Nitrospinota bacterium]